jgi:protoporphyrinogen oxidase
MNSWASGVGTEDMVLGSAVTAVIPSADGIAVEAADGSRWCFDQVVSTLPLHHLVDVVPGVPPAVAEAVSRLVVNKMLIATFGFEGEQPNDYTAVYIPDADYHVNRVSYPAVFAPENAPPGCFSVQAEITCLADSELLAWSDDALYDHMLSGLRTRSLVPADREPVMRYLDRIDHGYVVYTNGYEDDLRQAEQWFANQRITIHGRYGRHQYNNIDGCLRSSIDLARKLGSGLTDEDVLRRFRGLAGNGER